ncbi:MAG: hypothetical protein CMD18_00050 [Flavobacteriales bacterium]|nr:hypothetical protein [Flavobacteriales bacterium]
MKKKVKLDFLTPKEKKYFDKLSLLEKKNLIKQYYKLNKLNSNNIPCRFKLLTLNTTESNKSYLLELYDNFIKLEESSEEYFKYKLFFDSIIQIPFNIYNNINISNNINEYLLESKKLLNNNIYGHIKTKEYIIQVIGQYITNPNNIGNILGLCGPPGTGKTTFVKNISQILQRPVEIINLSGSHDVSYLEGHGFTYQGSKYGKIIHTLIKHKSMNPIIFFDEVDKISKTDKGNELENLLINIVDITQNYNYTDKYFQEITIDLSKILFVFSYNDPESINPILKDRIYEIQVNGYSYEEKIKLTKDYLIPNILKNFSFKKNDIIISDNSIEYIIDNYSNENSGVRELIKIFKNILAKIHIIYITNNSSLVNINRNIYFPLKITKNNIKQFI